MPCRSARQSRDNNIAIATTDKKAAARQEKLLDMLAQLVLDLTEDIVGFLGHINQLHAPSACSKTARGRLGSAARFAAL